MQPAHTQTLMILAGVGVVTVVGVAWYFLRFVHQRKWQKRLERIRARHAGTVHALQVQAALRKHKQQEFQIPALSLFLKALPSAESLADRLARAELSISPQSFILLCFGLFVMTFGGISIGLHGKPIYALMFGIIIGLGVPFKYLRMRTGKISRKFLKLFPDAIDLMVRGLRSGLPLSESMKSIAQEVPNPVGGVFDAITNWMALGVPMEKALQDMAKKMDMTEFNFFVTSIVLQRETGGNLGEILNNLSEVLRRRTMMQLKIRAMTSEARASSYIVGALPFFVSGAVFTLSPDYMQPLIDDPRGNFMAGVAMCMLVSGMWVMRRMGKFEI